MFKIKDYFINPIHIVVWQFENLSYATLNDFYFNFINYRNNCFKDNAAVFGGLSIESYGIRLPIMLSYYDCTLEECKQIKEFVSELDMDIDCRFYFNHSKTIYGVTFAYL